MGRVCTRSDQLQELIFEVELPVTQWKVLFAVDGNRDANSLSDFLGIPQVDIDRALDSLSELKLLSPVPAGPGVETVVSDEPEEGAAAAVDTDKATREIEEAFQQEIVQKEENGEIAESEQDILEFPAEETVEEESIEIGDSGEKTGDVTSPAPEAVEEDADSADEEFDQLIGQLLEEPEEGGEKEEEVAEDKLVADDTGEKPEAAPEAAPKTENGDDFDFGSLFQEDMAETEQSLTDLMGSLEDETAPETGGAGIAEEEAPAPETRHTILVVDDSVVIRKMVEIALENENYEIVSVANGKDALKFLDENTPSLVILDIMLPDVNGLDILKAIKASKEIPVVMLSAKDTPRETSKAKELGADDFIPKPFKDEELVSKIRELIGA